MTFASVYAIVVGLGMIGQWGFLLARKQVPELESEPLRIAFHLAGEFATALALVVGGIGLLTEASWGESVYLISMGMLLYTVVVSPGYFAQRRRWAFVGMFAIVFLLAVVSLVLVL